MRIIEADRGKARRQFIDLPYRLHSANPLWVPPLRLQQKDALDPHNPFYGHAQIRLFLAVDDRDRPIGRIAAINDQRHNDEHAETTAHFGFLDSTPDAAVVAALFAQVEAQAAAWHMNMVRGPFSPSINHECGLLIDGFDSPAVVMMPYNPPWLPPLVDQAGYTKSMDLLSYKLTFAEADTERIARMSDLICRRYKVTVRNFDRKRFQQDAMIVWDIYTRAWENNWGQTSMTEAEFKHFAKDLERFADPRYLKFVQTQSGEVVAFLMCLPNLYEALIHLRDGRLLPFGWAKALWHSRRGRIRGLRGILLGVVKEWRGRGLNAVLYHEGFKVSVADGQEWVDIGWILETNAPSISAADVIGAKLYKRYRIYEKHIGTGPSPSVGASSVSSAAPSNNGAGQ